MIVAVVCPACRQRFLVRPDDRRVPLHVADLERGGTVCPGHFGTRPPDNPPST
jgi:hypothetical protein